MISFVVLCLLPIAGGVLVGYLRGGRTVLLAGRFRMLWLLWLAAVIQMLQYFLPPVRRFFDDRLHIPMLWLVFAIVAGWVVANLRGWPRVMRAAAALVLAGLIANVIAIAANGRMPYSPSAAAALGKAIAETPKNEPATEHTRFAYLGDIVPVPVLRKIVSGGDILIGAGIVVFLAAGMRREATKAGTPAESATIAASAH